MSQRRTTIAGTEFFYRIYELDEATFCESAHPHVSKITLLYQDGVYVWVNHSFEEETHAKYLAYLAFSASFCF